MPVGLHGITDTVGDVHGLSISIGYHASESLRKFPGYLSGYAITVSLIGITQFISIGKNGIDTSAEDGLFALVDRCIISIIGWIVFDINLLEENIL
jgi:hypothetical protein